MPGRPLRTVVLCADDFGLRPGVDEAIRLLAEQGRISALSCMANMPRWAEAARALAPLNGRVGIGLHLTLTEGGPLGSMPLFAPGGRFPSLGAVAARALGGRLPEPEIAAEINRQLEAFTQALGRPPDFVDGHQHVHALPGIRGPLLSALQRRGLAGRVWLRDPSDTVRAIAVRRCSAVKATVVRALACGFGRAARRAGFATNLGFSGFSPFDPAVDPERVFAAALDRLGPNPVVMCHPGLADDGEADDSIAAARAREYAFLASGRWPELLGERRLRLVPAPVPLAST